MTSRQTALRAESAATPFDRWLATAPLLALVTEHAALNRWLNLPGAEHWPEMKAENERRLGEIWAAIGNRFPEYIARDRRLAAERVAHEARVRREIAA